MDSQKDYVLRTVEERGIRFVQLWFTDVLGIPKAFNITPAELENALDEGMTFDGSAIDGFSRVQESDVLAVPDPKTFQMLPYLSEEAPVARVVCDIFNLDGTAFEGDPRHVLRRVLDQARDQGFSFYVAPELEYFYFAQSPVAEGQPPVPLDKGSYFELMGNNEATALRRETVLMLEEMGIPVEYSQHEDAPSQHEIDLRYTDAMTMADTVMLVRVVVKEMAARNGILATFMPKPLGGVQGSGMHTHVSFSTATPTPFTTTPTSTTFPLWQGSSWRASPPRQRDNRHHEPMGQLLQAPHHVPGRPTADRSARLHFLGAEQPLCIGPGPADQKGQEGLDADRVPLAGPRRQPLPGIGRHPGGRPGRYPRPLRATDGGVGQHLPHVGPGAHGGKDQALAGVPQRTRSMPWRPPSWSPRPSASMFSNGSCATRGRSGQRTRQK